MVKNGKYVNGYVTAWYQNDQLHREDGPAIEVSNDREKWWYINGKRHREDGPAYELLFPMTMSEQVIGTFEWWQNDLLHRVDGPAIQKWNGDEEWWINGKRHREDGPAVSCLDGYKEWWIDGVKVKKQDVIQRQQMKQQQLAEETQNKLTSNKIDIHPDSVTFDMIEQCNDYGAKLQLIESYGLHRYWHDKTGNNK